MRAAGTKAFKKMITDKAEIDGLPASALALAAQQAASQQKKVHPSARTPCQLYTSASQRKAAGQRLRSFFINDQAEHPRGRGTEVDMCSAGDRPIQPCAELDMLCLIMQNAGGDSSADGDAKEPTAEEGPWLLTLDFPSYLPVQQHAKNRCNGQPQQLQVMTCVQA